MSRSFEDVQKLSCTQENEGHECTVTYGDRYQTTVNVEGVLLDGSQSLEYNGGATVELDGQSCKTQGNVLVCQE